MDVFTVFGKFTIRTVKYSVQYKYTTNTVGQSALGKSNIPRKSILFRVKYCPTLLAIEYIVRHFLFSKFIYILPKLQALVKLNLSDA